MFIDFHTHTFPDRIADRAIARLEAQSGVLAKRGGTVDALLASMKKNGIAVSVVLPVATNAKQVETINASAAELNDKNGICHFGAIHPDCENYEEILDFVKAAGLRGIKLHPDYQGTYFDDPRMVRILAAAARRGLLIVTHAGVDVGYPDDVHCTPKRILSVLDQLGSLLDHRLILAHMGACDLPEEVLASLAGRNIYFDTSFVLDKYPDACMEIINRHGADRILFATDSPWADQGAYTALLNRLPLTEEAREKITYRNAAALLGIAL